MKPLLSLALAIGLSAAVAVPAAFAEPDRHDDHHDAGPPHHDWHNGGRIAPGDWARGAPVDYRAHHLRQPPHGYEWREVDGNYVLAAAATGLIAGLIASGH
jgi:Ni/Co efflux regulator RcnB